MDRLHYIYIKYIPTYIYIYKYIYIYTYIYVYIDIIIRNVHMYNFQPNFFSQLWGTTGRSLCPGCLRLGRRRRRLRRQARPRQCLCVRPGNPGDGGNSVEQWTVRSYDYDDGDYEYEYEYEYDGECKIILFLENIGNTENMMVNKHWTVRLYTH